MGSRCGAYLYGPSPDLILPCCEEVLKVEGFVTMSDNLRKSTGEEGRAGQ